MLSLRCHVYFLNKRKSFPLNSIRNLETFEIRKVFNGLMTYIYTSEMLKNKKWSEKSVRIMEVIELQRFELWKAKYKSFLRPISMQRLLSERLSAISCEHAQFRCLPFLRKMSCSLTSAEKVEILSTF